MTREKAIRFLITKPYKFGHLLGFTKLSELHNEWILLMLKGKEDFTLQASRGTFKTTCVSIALAIQIILMPNMRTLFIRKTDNDIKEVIKQVSKILQDPHTQHFVNAIYGVQLKLNVKSATEITTNLTTDIKGTSQLVGVGMGTSLTGKHFDRIYTDDIVNVKDRISKAEREQTKVIYQELQNIKNRGGKIFNTGTPWAKEDCFSIMPEAVKYNCYHPLIRQIISENELQYIKKNMSPSLFAANYELKHIADENTLFTEPKQNANMERVRNGVCQVDAAFYGEDYTAFTVMAYSEGVYYTFGKIWRKHVEDCYGEIFNLYSRLACGKLYLEKNADKGMVARDLKNMGIRTVPYNEKMNKHIKISTYLKAIWDNVCFVDGTDAEYINQICDYTEEAEHDDAPDSMSCLARLLYPKIAKREGRKNIVEDVITYEE